MSFGWGSTRVASHITVIAQKDWAFTGTTDPKCRPINLIPAHSRTGQRGNRGIDIERRQVPKAAGGGSIRIKAGEGKALGACRYIRPGQLWQFISTANTETLHHRTGGQWPVIGKVLAGNGNFMQGR